MRRILVVCGIAIFLVGVAVLAELDVNKLAVKTLLLDLYAKLVPGKKLALVWKDADFKGGPPSAVAVAWKVEDRNGNLFQYLKTQAMTLAEPEGIWGQVLYYDFFEFEKV